MRNNKGPKIEPCGTPTVTLSQDECWPFRTTLCFRQERKSRKRFKRFPEVLFWFSLRRKPSCHTLSKALDISKKTYLTSNPLSNDLYISWVIASNWLTQESPGLNPDWFGEIILISVKMANISLKMRGSKILLQIGSKEIGLYIDF